MIIDFSKWTRKKKANCIISDRVTSVDEEIDAKMTSLKAGRERALVGFYRPLFLATFIVWLITELFIVLTGFSKIVYLLRIVEGTILALGLFGLYNDKMDQLVNKISRRRRQNKVP